MALGAVFAFPGPASAAISCDFGSSILTVTLDANNDFPIIDRSGQAIRVQDNLGPDPVCSGDPATVANTERIDVNQPDPGEAAQVVIDQSGGAFEPGTGGPAEGVGAPEIEFAIDLGDGFDSVQIDGRPDPEVDHMRFGELASGNPGVNLNAPEAGQPDGDDLELQEVDFISVFLSSPGETANTLDGSGGPEFVGGFPLNFGGVGGGEGPDTLVGGDAGGTYDGFGGGDTLVSRPGSFSETLRGGTGTDVLDYSLATSAVTVNLGTAAGQDTGGAGFDVLDMTDFEDLTGSPHDDNLTGTASANEIAGAEGADTIALLQGADRFEVMDGTADTVNCGVGDDAGVADEQGVDTINANCESVDFPPQTSIEGGPADAATINDQTPTYELGADEPATFEHRVDGGGFQACGEQCTVSSLSDGEHLLEFRAVDQDDPDTPDPTPAARDVTIDATPPQTAITSGPASGAAITDATPTFGFSSEAEATFQCRVDGGAFAACSSPRTTAPLPDGNHTFTVRARDSASNLDPTPANRSFSVDTTAPDTTISSGPKRKVKTKRRKAKARFRFGADDPEAQLECSLDDEPFASCSSPVTEKVKKGRHTFDVRGIDALGNVEVSPATHEWKVKRKR